MKPKIVTSYRPHGKWGDFLAAIVPGLWCLNILTNSNFILRLLEWQSESSLFTVRIRARQWYWVYKMEMRGLIDILSTPKSMGRGKWMFSNFGDYSVSDSYFHILQLRFKSNSVQQYWSNFFNKISSNNQDNIMSIYENNYLGEDKNFKLTNSLSQYTNNYINLATAAKSSWTNTEVSDNDFFNFSNNYFKLNSQNQNYNNYYLNSGRVYTKILNNKNLDFAVNYSLDSEVTSRYLKRGQGLALPLRLVKAPLDLFIENQNRNSWGDELFNIQFNSGVSELKVKPMNDIFYYTIKQVKYRRRTNLPVYTKYEKNLDGSKSSKLMFKGRTVLLNNSIFTDYLNNAEDVYNLVKKNKVRNDLIPVTLARRIIRTRRTLVLPAHTNITLITNSFDVVHSWFVPGLGLKIDCVPGRSTHHILYIDNVGFYYGQCAEICGRYHHHMPIRVCALPFEHFLIWWNVFGLPRVMFTNNQQRYSTNYAFRKFLW